MIGYIFALLPLYIFVYLPLSNTLFGGTQPKPQNSEVQALNSSFIADDEPLDCLKHTYETHVLSYEPLIVYIEGFISEEESEHLLRMSENKYEKSTISNGGETSINPLIRNSEVAILDRTPTVRCLEHRARSFQAWNPNIHIERLRTQRYGVGGHYSMHYDWSGGNKDTDRVSTFMVYVEADCEGGGTEFPRVRMPDFKREGMGRLCEFLKCGEDIGEEGGGKGGTRKEKMGVIFKPIKGNAVFWVNMGKDGRGYEETWHAGLPVTKGTKVGLNIWSWGPSRRN